MSGPHRPHLHLSLTSNICCSKRCSTAHDRPRFLLRSLGNKPSLTSDNCLLAYSLRGMVIRIPTRYDGSKCSLSGFNSGQKRSLSNLPEIPDRALILVLEMKPVAHKKQTLATLTAVSLFLLATPSPAAAYTDPGSGAMIWQLIMATMLGAGFYFRRAVFVVKDKLRRK